MSNRVDLRDIKPTLLDYLGIEDDTSHGRSLMPLIRGEVNVLPEPHPSGVVDAAPGEENIVEGRDPAVTRRLIERLKELGYVE